MKGFIKTWWHCLWRDERHRICRLSNPELNSSIQYACSCECFSYEFEE